MKEVQKNIGGEKGDKNMAEENTKIISNKKEYKEANEDTGKVCNSVKETMTDQIKM